MKDKKEIWGFVASLIAIFVIMSGILSVIFSNSLANTKDAEDVFIQAISYFKTGEISRVSELFTSDFKQQLLSECIQAERIHPEYCFSNWIKLNRFDQINIEKVKIFFTDQIPWNNRVRTDDKVRLDGTFKLDNHERKDIQAIVVKEGVGWKIGQLTIKN